MGNQMANTVMGEQGITSNRNIPCTTVYSMKMKK